MRGRKPTPTVLKLIRGNPGRRKIPIDEFQPEAAIPECPPHIIGAARDEWDRVTKLLSQVICEADRGALSMLCTAWGRYVEAEKQINLMAEHGVGAGLFIKAPKSNYAMQSPWLAVSNRAIELHTKLCLEFGLTPSARTRVSTNNVRPKGGGKGPDSGGWGQF